jgi:selenocysteine-specific elongation factor
MSELIDLPLIIGTAGHVDHGKTTLIRALTGVDTDRLEEEKRRGMTIDLGFAPFRLPNGRLAGVVDVPGHERFLKNMLAGAGGIDLVLLVVAADDGVMPQTREHLDILATLHVPRGLVVLTKTDLVEPELLELAQLEVREALAGSFLADAPVIAVSASTGDGLDALTAAIEALAAEAPRKDASGPARLPIDRVFTKQGFGTVITGTLFSGTLREGDILAIEPSGLTSRVRGLQVHGEKRSEALAGQRVAVNLAGLEKQALGRGDWLVTPHTASPSTLIDVQLELLAGAPPLNHRMRVRFHHGTAEVIGRVILLDRDTLAPGEAAPAQLLLEDLVVTAFGDRFVLRRYAPSELFGGGRVLHPSPAKHKRRHAGALAAISALEAGDPLAAMETALKQAGSVPVAASTLLGYVPRERQAEARAWLAAHAVAVEGDRHLHREAVEALAHTLSTSLAQFHAAVPWRQGLSKEELASRTKLPLPVVARVLGVTVRSGALAVQGRFYHLSGHQATLTPELERARAGVLAQLATAPLADLEDLAALKAGDRLVPMLDDMVEGGQLVRISGGIFATAARFEAMKAALRAHFAETPELTASQARERLGTSRKYLIPFLEYLDAQGFTRRHGDVRRLVPKADRTASPGD